MLNTTSEQSSKTNQKILYKILRFAMPYKSYLFGIGTTMILVAGVDILLPLLTLHIIDNHIVPGDLTGIGSFIALYCVIIIVQTLNIFLFINLAGRVEVGICHDIRRTGFEKLQQLSFSYFDKTAVGWLMARMTSDCHRLGSIVAWGLVDLCWSVTAITGVAVVMLLLHWKLALVVLSVVPVLIWISITFQRIIFQSYRKVRKTNSRITGAYNEGIMAVQTTKTLVREKENSREFSEITDEMLRSSCIAAIQSSIYLPIVQMLGAFGCGLALWYGGSGVIAETITYGTLVAFIAYTRHFFDPILEMARIFAELQNARASAERIFSMIETQPQIQNIPDAKTPKARLFGEIEFRNVSFAYNPEETVLDSFSLHIKSGETIALVGETGSGKSTIVNLVCRFYEPTSGSIYIDGQNYQNYSLQWLHSNLGIVLQHPHLFSGTIAENIRYGKLDATDEEVERAAKLVYAHDFIMEMEQGYNSEVGEGGSLLSTGQKQLISFARAIVANPRLLIMDEATSSIDTGTEQKIQAAISKIVEGRTCFIIAHRLSTIREADRILVINKGKIVEQGSHLELIRKKGHYYQLCSHQFDQDLISLGKV